MLPGVAAASALVRQLRHLDRGDGELVLLLEMLLTNLTAGNARNNALNSVFSFQFAPSQNHLVSKLI